jgi:hypothetical protein
MIHIKPFNESLQIQKELTTEQVNNFNEEELGQFLISYGDGQGDTYLKTLKKLYDDCGFSEPDSGYEGVAPYMEAIDWVYKEHGGNMVEIGWIENNKLLEIVFLD